MFALESAINPQIAMSMDSSQRCKSGNKEQSNGQSHSDQSNTEMKCRERNWAKGTLLNDAYLRGSTLC